MKNWYMFLLSMMAALVLLFALTIFYEQSTPRDVVISQPIPVILKSMEDNPMVFWGVVHKGMFEAAREEGLEIYITGPDYEKEIDQQIQILSEIIASQPPLIILAAGDYKRLVDSVAEASSLGIPIVTIDSAVDSPLPVSFIATDNIEAGQKAAERLLELTRGDQRDKLAVISHLEEAATAIDREAGFLKTIPEKRYLGTWYCDVEEDKAYEITRDLLLTHQDLGGLIALNEASTLGAARAVEELGVGDSIPLVGFDNAARELTYLESGVIDALVVQRPYNMGYMSIKIAADYLRGEAVPDFLDTGSVLIDRDNMFDREYQELLYPFSQ